MVSLFLRNVSHRQIRSSSVARIIFSKFTMIVVYKAPSVPLATVHLGGGRRGAGWPVSSLLRWAIWHSWACIHICKSCMRVWRGAWPSDGGGCGGLSTGCE